MAVARLFRPAEREVHLCADGPGVDVRDAGLEIAEVPIVFAERRAGGSKMTRGIVLEAMWKVPELRLRAALNRL